MTNDSVAAEVEKAGLGWYPVDGIAFSFCIECGMEIDPVPVPIQDVDANGDVAPDLCMVCYEKRMLRIQDAMHDAAKEKAVRDYPEESDVRDQT